MFRLFHTSSGHLSGAAENRTGLTKNPPEGLVFQPHIAQPLFVFIPVHRSQAKAQKSTAPTSLAPHSRALSMLTRTMFPSAIFGPRLLGVAFDLRLSADIQCRLGPRSGTTSANCVNMQLCRRTVMDFKFLCNSGQIMHIIYQQSSPICES